MAADHELERSLGELRASGRRLDDDLAEFRRGLSSARAEVDRLRAAAVAERRRDLAEDAQARDSARRGEQGPAMQELQRRLDRDETSMRAVMTGEDEHWSAREVRAAVVGGFRRAVDDLVEEDPEFSDRFANVSDLPADRRAGEWPDETPSPEPPRGGGTW